MLRTAPHKGEYRLLIAPNGQVVAPDLTEPLLSVLRELGGAGAVGGASIPCAVRNPRLTSARVSTENEPSLLDRNIALGRRLLENCGLCERRCHVNRSLGETGFCGLAAGLSDSGYAMLYNEGPFVGQPTFGVFLRGCSLRCRFCYRPKDLSARGAPVIDAACLARVLDEAAEAGAESWHFLGGNPDESLVGVLEVLRLTKTARPVVWNYALYLTEAALQLLKGIVDIWIPDFKFGNDTCAAQLAGVPNYSAILRRNLLALSDEPHVVVRHMHYPGHDQCCWEPIRTWLQKYIPQAVVHELCFVPTSK